MNRESLTQIIPPTHCPCCASELINKNNLLYCINDSCSAQSQKKVEHFAKTLKIKGLGPKAIEKLGVTTPQEIYLLTKEYISEKLGSERLAEKLEVEIENSKKAPLNAVLPALSIPLVGRSLAEKLAEHYNSFQTMYVDQCESANLGPKTLESLTTYINEHYREIYELPFDLKFIRPATTSQKKGTVCISGKLTTFKTKAEATEKLQSLGYDVKGSLTKDVTILVNESGIESAKTRKARDSGVTIVTDLTQLIGEIQ